MKFRKGDRVKLVNIDNGDEGYYNNDISNTIGNIGTVIMEADSFDFIAVTWDDNKGTNEYQEFNLSSIYTEDSSTVNTQDE